MRPCGPVPVTAVRSSLACSARRRASGLTKILLAGWPARPCGAGEGWVGAVAGVGLDSGCDAFGGEPPPAPAFAVAASPACGGGLDKIGFAIGDFGAVASADLSSPSSSKIAIG